MRLIKETPRTLLNKQSALDPFPSKFPSMDSIFPSNFEL